MVESSKLESSRSFAKARRAFSAFVTSSLGPRMVTSKVHEFISLEEIILNSLAFFRKYYDDFNDFTLSETIFSDGNFICTPPHSS